MNNTETMEFDEMPISVRYEVAGHQHVRGARDSLGGQAGMGPPLEPDEDSYAYQLVRVMAFDVDITDKFRDLGVLEEEEFFEEVYTRFEELMKEL